MTNQLERLQALHAVVDKLPSGRQAFAHDLMNNYRRFKKLSDKQMEWVEKLIEIATAPPKGASEYSQIIPGFQAIRDILNQAATKVKWPAIRLMTQKGQRFKVYPRQNRKDVCCVKVGDYNGDVSGEVLDTSYLRFLPDLTDVLNCLHEFAAHPKEMALLYSKKTSTCCFCGLGLENPASIMVGYGPICAENYGLPWGDKPEKVTVGELEQLMEIGDATRT